MCSKMLLKMIFIVTLCSIFIFSQVQTLVYDVEKYNLYMPDVKPDRVSLLYLIIFGVAIQNNRLHLMLISQCHCLVTF